MPLPKEVGQAIAEYIKKFRGKSTSRSLLVSFAPPFHGYARSSCVSAIVKRALQRAKIESKHQGAYLLRHTVANECLKNGASLREVGQILRHKSDATTAIYAKVDFSRLSAVSRPWAAGGVQ
jgi:site-specific recombinase XerD